jgi:hypothetical protein
MAERTSGGGAGVPGGRQGGMAEAIERNEDGEGAEEEGGVGSTAADPAIPAPQKEELLEAIGEEKAIALPPGVESARRDCERASKANVAFERS